MLKNSKLIAITFVIILSFVVVGNISVVQANDKVELRISWWGSEARHNATLEAIDLYEELNPNVKITPEYQGWDGYRNKLISQVTAGNAPDIFTTIMEWYPELIKVEAMVDLTGMLDVSGHNPMYVEACSMNGKMYGVNLSTNALAIYQNDTVLEKYGIEPLQSPFTWDDYAAKLQEVYDKSGGEVYGGPDWTTVNQGMGFDIFSYYGRTKLGVEGPYPFNNETYTFNGEQLEDFLKFFADMREVNAVAPAEMSSINDASANSLLLQRKAAYEMNYTGGFANYQNQTTDDLSLLPFPEGDNGETGDLARPGLIFSVAKNSKNKEEAAKFIEWFTTSPEAAMILKTARGVLPTEEQRRALVEAEGILSPVDKKIMKAVDLVLKRDLRLAYSGPEGFAELSSSVFPEYGQMIAYDYMTIDEAVRELMNEVENMGN